ncbi:MAG: DEAD/DEAH box helicase [Actinomycetia bacterium]|nr:DEAD/DEAH box helicase [Actinomycetes bacterium]
MAVGADGHGAAAPAPAGGQAAHLSHEHHPDAWLELLTTRHGAERVTHIERLPERRAVLREWPSWVAPEVYSALVGSGIRSLWSHQREGMDAAWGGSDVVVSTGTASGKSLVYLVPTLSAVVSGLQDVSGRGATTLYLSPTKALAADQLARLEALAIPGVRAATYDGDTAPEERRWAREHAHLVLSNPDLVHHSLLPRHRQWSRFLRALRYVVIDECHVYRGVFGSHVASVIRRLRRVAARYGSDPTFVLASATVADPGAHGAALIGRSVRTVEVDTSPRAEMTAVLWEPHTDEETGARTSATTESASLLTELVEAGAQTVAFARSRAGVEALSTAARRRLESRGSGALADRVAAYRGGYLPQERREIEADVRSGAIRGLAATNALELGVDINGLDAVLVAGWPGRRASLWQQWGRAGRAGQPALGVFVAADDPLDAYLLRHPEAIFGEPVERTVMDPGNPRIVAPHLAAAAAEIPLTPTDLELFGPHAADVVERLTRAGILRRRPTGWFWAREDRASGHVSLRGVAGVVSIVERSTGRVIGTIDEASAHQQVHTGAVHVHQGQTYVVVDLDLETCVATVVRGDPGWSTMAQSMSEFRIEQVERSLSYAGAEVFFGAVRVTGQVTSFIRRLPSGEVIGQHPLDLPSRTLHTRGVWWTQAEAALAAAGIRPETIPGAAHAAEHAAIAMLPLMATCDRWDIGGVSTDLHPDTGSPTIMIYDGYPGGAGFSERAFADWPAWAEATLRLLRECRCERGCPSCVQSPKCGNGNEPLDKQGAMSLLGSALGG